MDIKSSLLFDFFALDCLFFFVSVLIFEFVNYQ